MKKVLFALLGIAALGTLVTPTEAAILSVMGDGVKIDAPVSVWDDATTHTQFMLGFDERQNVLLEEDLKIDDNLIYGDTIEQGRRVSSHMIFLNNPGNNVLNVDNVLWEFDGTILGVMSDTDGKLEAASNDLLGNIPWTDYPGSFGNRGFENTGEDTYSGVGTNILNVSMYVTEPGDWIRVVTASNIPEPVSILGLLAIAALGSSSILKRPQH
ncbi:MAG: hypothetical protein J7647_02605 [Cyanobacteria bacterium SBLK]|nr:hypothetical protein [Cyanobacteria bacterium SBLK]